MLKNIAIKSLYTLALAEGEGVGTAYEYFAKRLVLKRWLAGHKRPSQLLIAGLPEKYGASLDFLQVAAELGTAVTVIDDRPFALDRLQTALASVQKQGWLPGVRPTFQLTRDMVTMPELNGRFDIALSSEVMQRISETDRMAYIDRLQELVAAVALFAPNADNPAHTNVSGLSGLHLADLPALFNHPANLESHYIDMPPFPPGIVRDEEQRAQASSGRLEALAMWGLGYYARLEHIFSRSWRRRQAHIVYALAQFTPDIG